MKLHFLYILSFLAVGCGNIDKGVEITSAKEKTSTAAHITIASDLQLGPCKVLTIYSTNEAAATELANTNACASTNQPSVVRLKVNAHFPTNVSYCIVPHSSTASYSASCFTINGQADINLSTPNFIGISLVKESDLSAYTGYLMGQNSYPSFAYGLLR